MNTEQLYTYIKENEINTLDQLLINVELSESTIRRRLKDMQKNGLIHLTRGGVITLISDDSISVSDTFRFKQNLASKVQIAKEAASKIEVNDVIYLDNGTTIRRMFKYLTHKQVTVYTNGYNHVEEANNYGIKLNIIPGVMMPNEASIVGEAAIEYIADINFDKVFIGANGFSQEYGITTPHRSESLLKRQVLKQGTDAYILIDASKEGLHSKYKICNLDDYPLIVK